MKVTNIGVVLENVLRSDLVALLKRNVDCFAWSHSDMGGIDPKVITHQLNVDPSFHPIKQKRKKHGTNRNNAINEEVKRLLENGVIQEVQYPEWLVN